MASLTRFHRCISRSNSISRFYASKSDGQRFDEIANPQMQQFTSPNDASESDGQQYENVENLLRQRQFAPLNDTRGLNRDMNMVKLVGSIHAIENSFTSSDAGSRPMVRITLEMRTGYLHRSGDGSLRVERNFVPIRVFDHQLVPKCSRLQVGERIFVSGSISYFKYKPDPRFSLSTIVANRISFMGNNVDASDDRTYVSGSSYASNETDEETNADNDESKDDEETNENEDESEDDEETNDEDDSTVL